MFHKIVKKLFGRPSASPGADGFFLKVRCDRCSEAFRLFINKTTDLAQEFDENGNLFYQLNKEIIGGNCRNLIRVKMTFDGSKKLISKNIENGSFVDDA